MFVHPQFDPVALQLGPLALRWYGLMYLLGFALIWILGRYRIDRNPGGVWTRADLDDALFSALSVPFSADVWAMYCFTSSAIIWLRRGKCFLCGRVACPSTAAFSAC